MLVPLSWLKDFVTLTEDEEKIAEKLLLSGTKVEEITRKDGEVVFDFEITPNRGDCLGVIGIAREASVLFEEKLRLPEPFSETVLTSRRKSINFSSVDKSLCPYYTIGIIDNIKVEKSPEWIRKRLELVGIRPLNNIVDITNYVMMETGQPMHAFDYDKIVGSLILRASKEGEKVITIDGKERKLHKGAIIIEDSEKLIDLAGLMGGENSEVDENTSTIVLHVPIYNSVAIRRTSQYTSLRTEASNRFEKQLDPNGHRYAFERALHLLKIEAGGNLASNIRSINYPVKSESFEISIERVRKILGISISEDDLVNILSNLGFEILPSPSLNESRFEIRPPTWRPDVKSTEDISEEIGRIWGYNNFPKKLPRGDIPTHEDSFTVDWAKRVRNLLTGLGINETYSHSMTDAKSVTNIDFDTEKTLKVNNRMTVDYEYMRPTLLIGLLQSIEINLNHFDEVELFEFGRTFSTQIDTKTKLPSQSNKISLTTTKADYFYIKGIVEQILNTMGIKEGEFVKNENDSIWTEESSTLKIDKEVIGYLGFVKAITLKNFAINKKIVAFELDFDKLIKFSSTKKIYKALLTYPTVKEDVSLIIQNNITVDSVLNSIKSLNEKKILNYVIGEIFSLEGKKSVLLKLEYYDPKGTMEDKEIVSIRKKIIEKLKKDLQAEIRSKKGEAA